MKGMRFRSLRTSIFLLLAAMGMANFALGQTATGQISGTVTDKTGAVVAGAAIQALDTDTQAIRAATSDATGGYNLTLLPPGHYEIAVSKSGFGTIRKTAVQLDVLCSHCCLSRRYRQSSRETAKTNLFSEDC